MSLEIMQEKHGKQVTLLYEGPCLCIYKRDEDHIIIEVPYGDRPELSVVQVRQVRDEIRVTFGHEAGMYP